MFNAFATMPVALQLAATVSVVLVFVYVFGATFPWNPRFASHSQDGTLALYWMHRTHHTAYRDWFCEPDDSDVFDEGKRVFQVLERQGNVVMPLHGIYLWALGHAVRLYSATFAPVTGNGEALVDFWSRDFFEFLNAPAKASRGAADALFAVRWTASLFLAPLLFQLAIEVVWPLSVGVAAYFVAAAEQRRLAGAPESVSKAAAAATTTSVPRSEAASTAANEAWTRSVASVGFTVIFAAVVLPTMALEMTTLHPVCLCTCALLQCVRLLFLDESMLTSPKSYTHDRFTNKEEEKLFQQGSIFAFPLKQPHTLRYLCQAGALLAAVGLTLRPTLCLVVTLTAWMLTLCYMRLHRRVLVRVKAPDGGVDVPEAASDGFVDIGFSSYTDRMHAHLCVCYVALCALAVVFVVCAPFVVRRQSLFDFMNVFAPSYHAERSFYGDVGDGRRDSSDHTRGAQGLDERSRLNSSRHRRLRQQPTEDELFLSMTGAREMVDECIRDPLSLPRHFSCPSPVLNVFTLSEFFGVPWTAIMVRFAGLITSSDSDARTDGSMWMQYVSLTSLVMMNFVPALILVAYRMRRPYMSFDQPRLFMHEYYRQKEKFFDYWGVQADHLRARKSYPPPQKPFTSAESAASLKPGEKPPDDVVKTCISQEEYVLKQLTALLWVLLSLGVTSNLFLARGGLPLGVAAAVLLPAGVLYALQWMVTWTTRMAPEAFDPSRNRRQYDHISDMKEAQADDARRRREERENVRDAAAEVGEEAPSADSAAAPTAAAPATNAVKPPSSVPGGVTASQELPLIPPEHDRTRTFKSASYSYTTPAFNADGTGWSLSSRWCSPAALGEYTDGAWCALAMLSVALVCSQAYPAPSSPVGEPAPSFTKVWLMRDRVSSLVLGGLLVLFCAEVVHSKFWTRMDLLNSGALLFLQVAGGYAAVKGLAFTSTAEAPSGGMDAVVLWLRGFAQVITGPPELFEYMTSRRLLQRSTGVVSLALWVCMYRYAVACLGLLLVGVHSSLRMVRLMLESEEVRFVDPATEMERIYSAAKKPKQSKEPTQTVPRQDNPHQAAGKKKNRSRR